MGQGGLPPLPPPAGPLLPSALSPSLASNARTSFSTCGSCEGLWFSRGGS